MVMAFLLLLPGAIQFPLFSVQFNFSRVHVACCLMHIPFCQFYIIFSIIAVTTGARKSTTTQATPPARASSTSKRVPQIKIIVWRSHFPVIFLFLQLFQKGISSCHDVCNREHLSWICSFLFMFAMRVLTASVCDVSML